MAQKLYVGVNNIAQNVTKMYVGVNGVARKVVKGYVGVNGVAQQFFGASTPSTLHSWNWWESVADTTLFYINGTSYKKKNGKIAYYCEFLDSSSTFSFLLLSPDSDAVTYTVNGTDYTYQGTLTDVNNITWYWSGIDFSFSLSESVAELLLPGSTVYSDGADVASDLLDMIYAVPFNEDYQVGQTYTIPWSGDVEKTLRKALGVFLFENITANGNSYLALSDNSDTVMTNLMNGIRYPNAVNVSCVYYSNDDEIYISIGYENNKASVNQEIWGKDITRGFTWYSLPYSISFLSGYRCAIDSSGNISYNSRSGGNSIRLGLWDYKSNNSVSMLNLGVDLSHG